MTGLGGSNGLAATRDAGLLELELEAQVDPQTKKASPKLLGWLKYPGGAMNERQRVAIASWMNGSMDFSGAIVPSSVIQSESEQQSAPDNFRERLEALIKSTPKEKELPQSETAKKLLEIIQSATKQPISFESIRKSRKWENNSPDKATLLAALEEITPDWIRGSESEGYYIQD